MGIWNLDLKNSAKAGKNVQSSVPPTEVEGNSILPAMAVFLICIAHGFSPILRNILSLTGAQILSEI